MASLKEGRRVKLRHSRSLPLLATTGVLAILYTSASLLYPGFFTVRVFLNLLGDNAFLGITAIGMTFVILSGGIDLSVGAVVAFTGTLIASLLTRGTPPGWAMLLALAIGSTFGGAMGFLIHRYELPPFLVTLGGMFFARGMSFVVSKESVGITHPLYQQASDFGLPVAGGASLPLTGILFLGVVALGVTVAHGTRFGRNLYALGGNEASARLMGLPVGGVKIAAYALNGFCSALAGIVATLYMGSGNPAMGFGLELDAIASVVIGGTLLTGGAGSPAGTLVGVLIFGTLQTALVFDGRLNSWWLRIAVGLLLLLFILLQRVLSRPAGARHP
ncbi:MAG TPA: sugar ABC transporter permease YjfF [Verrucomicrobiales bacterium]|nr:sugar ABC transporter permease YjfF [Verrucomicrobiales bacterium]